MACAARDDAMACAARDDAMACAARDDAMAALLGPRSVEIPGRDDAASLQQICSRHKLSRAKRAGRFCWWVGSQRRQILVLPEGDREAVVARRQLMMLRRACFEFHFDAAQVARILRAIPDAYTGAQHGQAAALVCLFGRITDLQNWKPEEQLGFGGYDVNGNRTVERDELQSMWSESDGQVQKRFSSHFTAFPCCVAT